MLKTFVIILVTLASASSSFYSKNYKTYSDDRLYDPVPDKELILTPLIESGKLADARKAAEVNHPDFLSTKSYSGYFTVNKAFDSNSFFWFVLAEENPENAPVILWLQGGPGDSSLFGLFVENGPFEIKSKGAKISLRDTRWTKKHSVLYIDNPVGVGFSYTSEGGHATNQTQIGQELYEALQQFFTLFPNLQKNEFFVAGESFGGKFSTAVAYTIHTKNPNAKLKINLKGVAIDSGLVDPLHQHNYADYLAQIGLADRNTERVIRELEANITTSINNEDWKAGFLNWSTLMGKQFGAKSGFKTAYNYLTITDPTSKLIEFYTEFLEKSEVRKAIHVGNTPYIAEYYRPLIPNFAQSVSHWITELANNYRMVFYNGQLDVIVAYPNTVNFLRNTPFNNKKEYEASQRKIWKVNGRVAGYVKSGGNVQEVLVRNSGHLIAYDQPAAALDLITKFVKNIPIA